MSKATYEEVTAGLKRLKLSTIRHNLEDYLRLAATQSVTPLEFLNGLVKEEIKGRDESTLQRHLKAARFPALRRLEEFDFAFQPSLSHSRIQSLQDCRWLENAENIVFIGQAGVGKTHLAIGLGIEAIERGYRIYFSTVADLLEQMSLAAAINQLPKLAHKLLQYDGLILDELGYVRINRLHGNFLFHLISKAYEQMSLIITTNIGFSGWSEIFEDQVQVAALLDRLLHHATIFSISGESYRIKGHNAALENKNGHDEKAVRSKKGGLKTAPLNEHS